MTRPRLLLIDGHSMAYRAYFALPVDKFSTSSGQHTNAVHGFIAMLIRLIDTEEPTHVAVAFDAGSKTFRTEAMPEYKGTRDATPEPFKGQVSLIKEVLSAMRVPFLEKDNFEADDILATWSKQADTAGMEVLVCSGDRDTLQFVNENVTVLYPIKGVSELARMTPEAVEAKYDLAPHQYPDLAALVGETSDNIPGVPGVGPKTAAKWIKQFGSLEEILTRSDEIKGKAGESLRAHIDQVRKNRVINHLLTDVELTLAPGDLAVQDWDREEVTEIFDVLQFRTLRDRLFAMKPAHPDAPEQEAAPEVRAELHALAPGALEGWLSDRAGRSLGLDVAGKPAPGAADAWLVAIADDSNSAVVMDLADVNDADERALGSWLSDPAAAKVTHGAKADWHELGARGFTLRGFEFDTELAAYLCFPDQRSYDLSELTERHLHRELATGETSEGDQGAFDLSDDGSAEAQGLANRAATILELAAVFGQELDDRESRGLLRDLELPLTEVLARLEDRGIAMDRDYLRELERDFGDLVSHAAEQAYAVIGREVNLGSPKQLQEVLFDQLDMPKTKKIKTGHTTDAAALADLFEKTGHPFLEFLLAHRDAIRLRQTVEGLLKAVQDDGRIRSTFQQTVAATGRLSSVDPNLQNIPIRTPAGRRIRRSFVVGEGYETLLTADYSQIEMRIMAHLSKDAGLIEAFRTGEDLHNYVGARVFGVETSQVTPEMRSKIKAMSYGLAYGLSAFGLSKQLNIDVGEAARLMEDYFDRFGGVRDYLASVVAQARVTGYTETIMGRRRYLPDLTSDNRQRREMAERMALNAPIQGSAADIIKVAMLGVDRELTAQGLSSRMLLQIHDELLIEVATGELAKVEAILREQMGSAFELAVPLDVSVGVGTNWHDAGH